MSADDTLNMINRILTEVTDNETGNYNMTDIGHLHMREEVKEVSRVKVR